MPSSAAFQRPQVLPPRAALCFATSVDLGRQLPTITPEKWPWSIQIDPYRIQPFYEPPSPPARMLPRLSWRRVRLPATLSARRQPDCCQHATPAPAPTPSLSFLFCDDRPLRPFLLSTPIHYRREASLRAVIVSISTCTIAVCLHVPPPRRTPCAVFPVGHRPTCLFPTRLHPIPSTLLSCSLEFPEFPETKPLLQSAHTYNLTIGTAAVAVASSAISTHSNPDVPRPVSQTTARSSTTPSPAITTSASAEAHQPVFLGRWWTRRPFDFKRL